MRSYSLQGRWAPLRWTSLALAVALNLGGVRVSLGAPATIDPAPSSEATHDDQGPLRLEDVKSGRSLSNDAINPIRAEALKETALAYGARAGLYARAREINQLLDEEAGMLDRNFPFAPLILAHNVLPPVIQTGRDTVRQHHDAQLQFADAVYAIVRPARLAVAPPDWRTYLYVRAARPAPPDETLLPDRAKVAEVAYWERSVEDGWTRGVQQADQTLTVQLHRLERDLTGMALYRELLAKGMVTPPRLTERQRGVTTDRNVMRVNDRLLEIAENPRFQTENQRWKPVPTRPYRPSKRAPKVHLRVLGLAAPPGVATNASLPGVVTKASSSASAHPWGNRWER